MAGYMQCTTCFTYRGDLQLLSIIDVVHADFSIGQKVVALDLPGEQQITEQLVVGTGQYLVEDVVASLSRLLLDHSRLLQKVCMKRKRFFNHPHA